MVYTGPPMTLGNMRENGVRSLLVTCSNVTCRHREEVMANFKTRGLKTCRRP
jgi:hypothetical protein